jgi:hypothetical protein
LPQRGRRSSTGGVFLVFGAILLVYSIVSELQVAAFIGLGLVFWGALFAAAKKGKYVESSLLDATTKTSYATTERMIADLSLTGQGYYLPAYPQDVNIPQYLDKLREPVVFISENFDGKPPVDELAVGKFLSEKSRGVFINSPGAGLLAQMEQQLKLDFSKMDTQELVRILPIYLTERLNLARGVTMNVTVNGADFKADGVLFESLYRANPPLKSLNMLGCPMVSAVACAKSIFSPPTKTASTQFSAMFRM